MTKNGMSPVHPGEVLREELDDLGLSANALAKAIDVPANRVTAILNAERGITADTALRLGRYFDTTAQFWLNLQQTWELRRAETKSGPRILEYVVPRQAEALRTAAGQAVAAYGQSVPALPGAACRSMLKVIEQNAALCDQISATERAISLSTSHRVLRALANPLDELRSVGALETTFSRELHHTAQCLAEYKKRFQLANADDLSVLVAQLQAAPATSAVERLAAITTPWLDVGNQLGSVKRILELQKIGELIGNQATFSGAVAAQVRNWLGDWRTPVTWPKAIWRDPAARADFYDGLGFDADLTDMPAAAFREAAEIANIRSEPPSLVESYGPPVPTSSTATAQAAFSRTNEAHDWLQRFESHLRRFVDAEMTQAFGRDWPRSRLPNGMYDRWKAKKNAAARTRTERPLIAYADFTDYACIITRRDNWRQVFANYFERPGNVRESFQRLLPIRLDTMHARPIGQDDELLLYVEIKRIVRAIEN